jgi:mRNA-degrading endonuclease RelE of RelBE toxin-antitoxin system
VPPRVTKLNLTAPSFTKSYKRLSVDTQKAIQKSLPLLMQYPVPPKLHFHKHHGVKGEAIYTIHVTPDDCYKASFTIDANGVAVFRRVGTHAKIDNEA